MTNTKKTIHAVKTDGAGSAANLASRTLDTEALKLIEKTTALNGGGKVPIEGRKRYEFYWVPFDDKNPWERVYGRITIDEEHGHLVMATKAGSHIPGITLAGSYMVPEQWYKFPPSTIGVYVSERVIGSKGVEIIQAQEGFEDGVVIP